ncbi:ribulose-phosphate 3-epimerase [Bacteroidota bacterium]
MATHSRVVPAILTEDPQVLETMVRQVETFTTYAQIDIMDGQFVPSRSITWEYIAPLAIKFAWEAHLMTLYPEEQLEGFKKAGAQKFIFHYEATPTPQKVITLARDLDFKVGLAINPDTPVSAIHQLAGHVDSVLLLSVDPGFYGSPYIPEVLDKVAELRQLYPNLEIGMDGGIKESNIVEIAKSGVDTICVGSAIFLQPHPGESFRHLQSLVQGA